MSTEGKPTAKAFARAKAQRERILNAAQKCFVVHGFHAASMASIADTANMSAGLIYRYFKSKNDIILAIIERQLEEARTDIAKLHTSSDLVEGIAEVFEQWRGSDTNAAHHPGLFLEITAEATRDPEIAAATRASDQSFRALLREWMVRDVDKGGLGMDEDTVDLRMLLLQCVIEGLAMRSIAQPDLEIDTLKSGLSYLLPVLLSK